MGKAARNLVEVMIDAALEVAYRTDDDAAEVDTSLHCLAEEFFMRGFVKNIDAIALANSDFRRVLYTAQHCQLVVMALKP